MVRIATPADILSLIALGSLFFEESGMGAVMTYDPDSAEATFKSLIQLETAEIFVMSQSGQIVGAIGGIIAPFYFNNAVRCAQEFFWYVHPTFRGTADSARLVVELEKWARDKGAEIIDMTATVKSPASVTGFYKRRGYEPQETHFMGRL